MRHDDDADRGPALKLGPLDPVEVSNIKLSRDAEGGRPRGICSELNQIYHACHGPVKQHIMILQSQGSVLGPKSTLNRSINQSIAGLFGMPQAETS